jgi:predicted CXXCH cytochrome family protein
MQVLLRTTAAALLFLSSLCVAKESGGPHYVGPETCALCHKDIAASQAETAMANTWQGRFASWLPPSFSASVMSDNFRYAIASSKGMLIYSAPFPGRANLSLPIEIAMGGKRHGLGFLVRLNQIDGLTLARSALLQARYAWSPEQHKLLLAPGCSPEKPSDGESSLGLVLSPNFETRCLACHGQPDQRGSGVHGGVHCEGCHGPGSEHLRNLGRGDTRAGILNPKRLSTEESMAVCAQCHVGLARFSDPSPEDLLIANQVRAIRSSECFLQSGRAFSCTACHDPHRGDPPTATARTVEVCLGCHAQSVGRHAAICPIDAKANCVACHMPAVDKGPLHLVDHLIRVHPEQNIKLPAGAIRVQTEITPIIEYLRLIATNTTESASAALDRLQQGESFYQVARDLSGDKSSVIGGYLGEVNLATLGSGLAERAAKLNYGETSSIVKSGDRWIILQRLPRDFRSDAERLEQEAEAIGAQGDSAGAVRKAQSALMIYPHFLRALNFIAAIYANNGEVKKAADVLRVTANMYPNDAGTQFMLGSALAFTGQQDGANAAYRKAIALNGDFLPAYASLGAALYSANDFKAAIGTFRAGLQIDPMSAELYYDLGLALRKAGDEDAALQAIAIAGKLQPRFVSDPPSTAVQPNQPGSF